ncbi:MAG: hypothetical protein LC723_01890, partial [Actinobacteria bacterium]|nr:hypothetical protein [Actinomycetota bacterium]
MLRATRRKTSMAMGIAVSLVVAIAPALATSPNPVFSSTTVATKIFAGQPAIAVDRSTGPINPIYISATEYGAGDYCCTTVRPLITPSGPIAQVWRSLDG